MPDKKYKLQYKDIFWSSDYIGGITALVKTLEKGLSEGKICYNYFENHVALEETSTTKLVQFISSQEKLLSMNQMIVTQESVDTLSSLGYPQTETRKFMSIHDISNQELESLKSILDEKQTFISEIQSDVLLRLKDFLDDYKSFTGDLRNALSTHYNNYKKSLSVVDNTKAKFYTKSRQLDDYTKVNRELPSTVSSEISTPTESTKLLDSSPPPPPPPPQQEQDQQQQQQQQQQDMLQPMTPESKSDGSEFEDDPAFQFPLEIGCTVFEDQEELRSFLEAAMNEIPTKKRVISLPGINNQYFSSENLVQFIRKRLADEDSRIKIEKFGKSLVSLGLINNFNKLQQKVFVSDGGYYEFTDLSKFVVKFDEKNPEVKSKAKTKAKTKNKTKKTVKQQVANTLASQASTAEIWSGLKSKFGNPGNVEALREQCTAARNQYLEAVKNANHNQNSLELSILKFTKKAHVFDANRVRIIYELQNLFHQKLLLRCESQKKMLLNEIENLRLTDESLNMGLMQSALTHPIGWYWPKSEANFIDNVNPSENAALFGSDLVGQLLDSTSIDTKTKSTPLFILNALTRLNDIDYSASLWTEDIDISSANQMKQWALTKMGEVDPINRDDDNAKELLYKLLDELFTEFTKEDIVNFLKFWLLKLPDSLLPFTIYDTLLQQYDTKADKTAIIQTIGTIPRQNLSTLLVLVTHISTKFPDFIPSTTAEDHFRVPFVHLFLRPPPKRTYLNINDSFILSPLITDLLTKELQEPLYTKLEEMEQYHQEKEKRAEDSINRMKEARKDPSLTPPSRSERTSVPDSNHLLTPGGLRPFKTKSPLPSPSSSPPRQSPVNSPPTKPVKTHARVNSLLSNPIVKRPSDSLPKRHSHIE